MNVVDDLQKPALFVGEGCPALAKAIAEDRSGVFLAHLYDRIRCPFMTHSEFWRTRVGRDRRRNLGATSVAVPIPDHELKRLAPAEPVVFS